MIDQRKETLKCNVFTSKLKVIWYILCTYFLFSALHLKQTITKRKQTNKKIRAI